MNKPSTLLMIRPVAFGFNTETASSNSFQQSGSNEKENEIQEKALLEFNTFVEKLNTSGIHVIVNDDTSTPHTPDSIFPNNWISFHEPGSIILYPMLAANRRLERRLDIVQQLKSTTTNLIDLSEYENKQVFLEGTGSIVFDYANKTAYANISPRTDKALLDNVCELIEYKSISFKAVDMNGSDIYHTNVLMCIGNTFATICGDCIPDPIEKERIVGSLKNTGHEIIHISMKQMNSFAGNMYQVFNKDGEPYIIMSEQAYLSLSPDQIKTLSSHGTILHTPLYTIEKYGGGSARCMIADIRTIK